MFSESHPDDTFVIRRGYPSSTQDITPSKSRFIDIYVLSLCSETDAGTLATTLRLITLTSTHTVYLSY